MTQRVLLLASSAFGFLKSSSILRLSNELRKDGFLVTQIHHFLSFSHDDLRQIIEGFAASGGKLVCISTSFLSVISDKNFEILRKLEDGQTEWGVTIDGVDVFKHLMVVCAFARKNGCQVIIGGWEIAPHKLQSGFLRKRWGFDRLTPLVDAFVLGNGASVIRKAAAGEVLSVDKWKMINSDPITDYSDMSNAPEPGDHIRHQEGLSFEIASGCVFSCHFCGYGSLGKKKHEYMRTYESLKRELVSNWENFGTIAYDITDNIINDYHEKISFLRRIRDETGIPFRWSGYVRLDTIKTRQQADDLRDSGMAGTLMGIESFTASTGRYIGKVTDGERLKDTLRMCRESWGDTALISASLIAGLPTETEEQLLSNYEWLISPEGRHLIDTFKFNLLHVSPGSDDKNEINRRRNGPFKDYVVTDRSWTSPWSTSDRMIKLVIQMNRSNINRGGIHSQSLTQISSYGYSVADLMLKVRNGNPSIRINKDQENQRFLKIYRGWVMSDLQDLFK
jgi:radical SAM superfamily enzyme YgiQ (UPF0313 family)